MWVQLRTTRIGPHDLRSLLITREHDRAVPDQASTVWQELERTHPRSGGQMPGLDCDRLREI